MRVIICTVFTVFGSTDKKSDLVLSPTEAASQNMKGLYIDWQGFGVAVNQWTAGAFLPAPGDNTDICSNKGLIWSHFSFYKIVNNKKVLLRERKRHTARRVVSTPSVFLTGYPPSRVTPPHPDLAGGGYPARGVSYLGTPRAGYPLSWPGWGYPIWVPPRAE